MLLNLIFEQKFNIMKTAKLLLFIILTVVILSCKQAIPEKWIIESQEFIYSDENKPTPECHASTVEFSDNRIWAAWFGGVHERHPNVGIWLSHNDNGIWSQPVEVATGFVSDDERYPLWNPVLWNFNGKKLFLFYKMGPSPSTWWGMYLVSTDNGNTWSEPRRIPDPFVGPIKNKPVLLSNGKLLCPSSSEHDGWKTHFELFDPESERWEAFAEPPQQGDFASIQPTVYQHKDGSLQALMRTKEGVMAETWSSDMGKSWTKLETGPLPNNNSGFDGVTLSDGTFLMVFNPTGKSEEHWGGARYPLVVGISEDGKEWQQILTLEEGPGEFSYPAVIQSPDGKVHITYTHNRLKVAYVVLSKQ
jgi:predicted neuraminidase